MLQTASFPTTDTSNNIGFSRSYQQRLFFSRSHSRWAALLLLHVSHSNEPSCRKYCFPNPRRLLCFHLCGRGCKMQRFALYFGELSQYTQDTGLLKSSLNGRFLNPCRVLLPPSRVHQYTINKMD